MTSCPCIFKWIQFALGIRYTCSMQTLFDRASWYNYSVSGRGEPHVQCSTSARKKCAACATLQIAKQIFERTVYIGMNVQLILSKRGQEVMYSYKTWSEILICVEVLHIAEVVNSVWFAVYFNAVLHLAMDVTPACEHCRTSISNVLWRNSISGFNGSSEAVHPGSHEIYALVKLVYSINFPIFNYWHYCSACYCFFWHKMY